MTKQNAERDLLKLSVDDLLEEAAKRLKDQYFKEHGTEFLYGSFRFVFHEGRFQGVEDWPRNKRYVSPARQEKTGA